MDRQNSKINNRFKFEKGNSIDFPFYNDAPIKLSWTKWILWVGLTFLSYFVFSGFVFSPIIANNLWLKQLLSSNNQTVYTFIITCFLLVITFFIVFFTYKTISGSRWNALFKKLEKKEIVYSVSVGIVGMIMTVLYTKFILNDIFHVKTVADLATQRESSTNIGIDISTFITTFIQLILEEMWVIVPFLFVLVICHKTLKITRKTSILLAWTISSIIFGLYHIPSYDGNVAQSLLVIGVSRLFLTFPYLRYKNIWASYIAHCAWDFSPLVITLLIELLKK